MSYWRRRLKPAPALVILVMSGATGIGLAALTAQVLPAPAGASTASVESPIPVPHLTTAEIDHLPPVVYNAVIPGLSAVSSKDVKTGAVAQVKADKAVVFDQPGGNPVGYLTRDDFTRNPTVVSVIGSRAGWAHVLTPARKLLPSQTGGHAPAQTAAWVPLTQLTPPKRVNAWITVDVAEQTLTVKQEGKRTQTFKVGVGAATTGTPAGFTGYLEARYKAPKTATGNTLVQLTSMHSTVEDDPAGGTDGGLIALHYWPDAAGAESHGCVRLTTAALAAVNDVPLGTPIEIR